MYGCTPGENQGRSMLEEEHQLDRAAYADSVNRGWVEDSFQGSARIEASGKIGKTEVTIN